jgi:Protein of unknown function (DUF3618)
VSTTEPRPQRSKSEIEAELATARASLAATVDELSYRLQPSTVAYRTGQGVKQWFVDPVTGPNWLRIGGAAVGTVLVLGYLIRK